MYIQFQAACMVITKHAMYGSSSRIWLVPILHFWQLTDMMKNGSVLAEFINMFIFSNMFLLVM